jgi:hypothetical protein
VAFVNIEPTGGATFSTATTATSNRQFWGVGAVNDPDVAVFFPTLSDARPIYLSSDVYLVLSDTPGLPR